MSTFPSVKYDWRDLTETPDPVVERSPMERGKPKQRRTNSDARVELALTLHFDTQTEATDFETWFFTTINAGQDYFDLTHPVTGATVLARVVGGQLGAKTFKNRTRQACSRQIKVEYWRPAW